MPVIFIHYFETKKPSTEKHFTNGQLGHILKMIKLHIVLIAKI